MTELEKSLFPGLTSLGIDWRKYVTEDEELNILYNEYMQFKKEYVFINMDYKSLEVGVLASISKDPKMISVVNAGMDTHSENTRSIYGIDYISLEKNLKASPNDKQLQMEYDHFISKRKSIKSLTFSLSYGAGPEKIATDLKITVSEANDLIRGFYDTYPRVEKWQNETFLFAINNGYIETPFGRRRDISRIKGRHDAYKAFVLEDKKAISSLKKSGEYWSLREDFKTCKNTPIQSVASDMCSVAASKFKNWLKTTEYRARMMFWIHDAISFWCHIDDAIAVITKCSDIMRNDVKYAGDPVNYATSLDIGYNYEFMVEIKDFIPTKEFLQQQLDKSLQLDLTKKFKLLVKATSLAIDKDYVSTLKDTKQDYYDTMVERMGIAGVSTVSEYMAYQNNLSVSEWEEYSQKIDADSELDEDDDE